MTLNHFRQLSEDQQYRNLLLKGTYVAERSEALSVVLLFQLHGFYTEVFFHSETDELLGSRSFDNMDELEPYLAQIDLRSLLR